MLQQIAQSGEQPLFPGVQQVLEALLHDGIARVEHGLQECQNLAHYLVIGVR